MKVVVLANLRWFCHCPSWYQLAREGSTINLLYNGKHWYLTNGEIEIWVPDRDTGAMMLAKQLNKEAAGGGV